MKLLPALFLLSLTTASWGLDQIFLEPITPISPALKGQGGVATANAEGWDALFMNPAAYASTKTSLTFLAVGGAVNVPLSSLSKAIDNRDSWASFNLNNSNDPMVSLMNTLLTKDGLGAQTSVGAGWVGNNLGAGFLLEGRTFAKGLSLLGSDLNSEQTISGVIGMGWPIDVGMGTLKLGAALRPTQVTYSDLAMVDLMSSTTNLSAYTVYSGFVLGWDLGARWDYGPFRTGLTVRNVGGPGVNFKKYSAAQWVAAAGFPTGGGSTGTTSYVYPTVIGLGGSWSPDVGSLSAMFQPTLSVDFQIPIKDEFTQPSFWTWTHLGAEATFLQFLSLRTGLNQGYFTFGLGAKVFFFDFNIAIYADELGRYSGLNRRSALATELAFRL